MPQQLYALILFLFVLSVPLCLAEEELVLPETEINVSTRDGIELGLHQFPAKGEYLVLWIASGYGLAQRDVDLAKGLAQSGVEIWQIDFAQALFQVGGSNFMRNLNPDYVVDLIRAAQARTHKKVLLLSHSYGAIVALRGAALWQQQPDQGDRLSGVILFSPDLYASIPDLGLDPDYLPIVGATNFPLMIYQAGKRGNRWQFPQLLAQLSKTNENVFFKLMLPVTSVMYHGDTDPATLRLLQTLPGELAQVIRLLDSIPPPARVPAFTFRKEREARLDSQLKPYRASPQPKPIVLRAVDGTQFDISDYKGKVSVINFWASWCPPCVEEIPSLNRLRKKMQGKPFQLISVNYAQSPEVIQAFLKQVNVEFPVLLDTSGEVSARWNVIAYPSTFVIGSDGKIHYGVNAAIAWDAPEVIRKMEALMAK